MPGPSITGIPAGYMPSWGAELRHFKVTVTGVATRLADLITNAGGTLPLITDENYTSPGQSPPMPSRWPEHVIFQVPIAAANSVYVTWDNNTTPVVGGPGAELAPGATWKFESAAAALMLAKGKTTGIYQVNVKTAFQFIATAETVMLVSFSD